MKYKQQMRIEAAKAQGWSGPWRFGNEHLHGTPPNATQPATDWTDDKHVPESVDKLISSLCDKIKYLSDGIISVRQLMNESKGVSGLHLNGDIALWDELQEGGRFEEWLSSFNWAEQEIVDN